MYWVLCTSSTTLCEIEIMENTADGLKSSSKVKVFYWNEQGGEVEHVASWKELNRVGNSSMSESKSVEQEPRVRT